MTRPEAPAAPSANSLTHVNGATQPQTNRLAEALALATIGLHVFPLCRLGKAPAISKKAGGSGFADATIDEHTIREWFKRYSDANVGIRTGRPSGIIVIDIDPRSGGEATIADLGRAGCALPENTPIARTGNGGKHYYLAYTDGIPCGNGVLPGIDVKSDEGYVVAPPSFTGPSKAGPGGLYEWIRSPIDVALQPLPDWLRTRLTAPPKQEKSAPDASAEKKVPPSLTHIEEALQYVPADDRDDWRRVGQALFHQFGEPGRELWDRWSQKCESKYDLQDQDRTWSSFADSKKTGAGSVLELARKHGADLSELAQKHGDGKVRARILELSQVDRLVRFCNELELFRTTDGIAYTDLRIDDHRETWPIRSSRFRDFLRRAYYRSCKSAPNGNALAIALDTVEARARFDGAHREVYLRVARLDDRVYIDLCNEPWQAVEIDRDGCRVVDEPPVRFRRRAGMLPLPVPQVGGSVDLLRPFLNLRSDADFTLAVAWLLGALVPNGPCPILALAGEQGSAKSSTSMFLLSLVDPNDTPLRSLPRNDRDLFIAVNNSHALGFDNMSRLPEAVADSICRISTGGGFATRKLYSDDEEMRFNGRKPILINGIEEVTTRPDVADRALMLMCDPIPSEKRKLERELWSSFKEVAPSILGALCTAIARGLRRLPETTVPRLPRMADFAMWATACEEEPGAFMRAYEANRAQATALIVEEDPVAHAVRDLAAFQESPFRGTSTELLARLESQMSERNRRNKNWPTSARGLSGRLRRVAPGLRSAGIRIEFDQRDGEKSRVIVIEAVGTISTPPADAPSVAARNLASEPTGPHEAQKDQAVTGTRSEAEASKLPSDRTGTGPSTNGSARRPSAPKSLKNKESVRSDGSDAKIPPLAPDESDDVPM
jgi:hypothetical protein